MSAAFLRDFDLDKLVRPVGRDAFLGEYWERKPLVVSRNDAAYWGDLLDLDDLDELMATGPGRLGVIPNSEEGAVELDIAQTPGQLSEIATVELRRGSSLVLSQLELRQQSVSLMCRLLGREFGAPFGAAIYVSPPNARAFKAHVDQTDVFLLQVHGAKRWTVERAPRWRPRRDEHDDGKTTVGEDHDEFRLNAGDLLYIPRGVVHAARAEDEPSVHLTLRVAMPTWEELLKAAVRLAADENDELKLSLPVGHLNGAGPDVAAGLAQRLAAIADPGHLERVARRFADESMISFANDVGGLTRMALSGERPAPGDRVGPRRGLVYRRHDEGEDAVVLIGARRIAFPDVLAEQLDYALATPDFAVRDLPGDLDDEEKTVFVERLMIEGLIERKGE